MDFFEQQHHARRQTRLMVVMFLAAVVAIVASLNLLGVVVWVTATEMPLTGGPGILRSVPRELYLGITALTLVIIAFGTLSTLSKLSAGGAAVAGMVGARLVQRDSKEPLEQRLLNIVEEMAIASGISVPQAYVMDEERGINAFAAGYSPNEAVIAVTRGTLENLNRDELQGVIGHEFSHILNGDMRLNIHLMGVIAGIVMIGALGRFLMSSNRDSSSNARYSSSDNRSSSSSNRDTDMRVFLVGLALWLIGSIGVLAGRVIKAAIARQREFLADASAVQFTRNPEGIGAALFKIGQQGAAIGNRHAEDLSHMYFGESVAQMFDVLNTHPPVEQRIERLMGAGAQHLLRDRIRRRPREPEADAAAQAPGSGGFGSQAAGIEDMGAMPIAALQGGAALSAGGWGSGAATVNTTAQQVIDSVGKPTQEHYQAAQRVLQQLPAKLHEATRTGTGAQAVLFALLLGDGEVRGAQLASLQRNHGEEIARQAEEFVEPLRRLGPRVRMPLTELALPTLKELPADARDAVLARIKELIEADHKVTLGEFVLLTLCRRHLGRAIKGAPPVKHKSIDSAAAEAGIVLSLLVHAGRGDAAAFAQGMQALGLAAGVLRAPAELSIAAVESALYELKLLAPLKKPAFIKACLGVVMADGKLTVLEGELMRALCAALDSPLPPLLEGIDPVH